MAGRRVGGGWTVGPAVAAMAAVAAATRKGLYVSPDGVSYVGTARNLLAGHGLAPPPGLPPIGHFPPLFPVLLAAVGRLGPDPLAAARVVNVAAAGAVVVLVASLARRATGSGAAGLVAAVLAAAAVDLLAAAGSALSEPLFVVLALAAMAALAVHVDRGRSPGWLIAAAVLAAAAFLTRYVGVALVVAGAGGLLWFGKGRRWHGAVDAAVFGAAAAAPTVGFLAWAGRAPGAGDDRALAWHAFGLGYLGQAARPLARWILPWPRPPVGLVLAAAAVAAVAVLLRRHPAAAPAAPAPGAGPSPALPVVLGLFAAVYLLVVVANRLLTDASGRLDARFLLPLHVVAIVLAVRWVCRRGPAAPVLALAAALVVAQVAGAVAWTAGGLSDTGTARRGYTAAAWRSSPVLARIRGTDPAVPVYSNAFDAIELLTTRSATPVPAKVDYLTGRANPAYAAQVDTMRATLARGGGYVAWFDAATFRRSFLPSRAELESALPLDVVARDEVGTLYRLR